MTQYMGGLATLKIKKKLRGVSTVLVYNLGFL